MVLATPHPPPEPMGGQRPGRFRSVVRARYKKWLVWAALAPRAASLITGAGRLVTDGGFRATGHWSLAT